LDGNTDPNLRTFLVYVPTLGAKAEHIPDAVELVTDGNATHYWEESGIVGRLFEKTLSIEGTYAWDVWLVYKPGARWDDEYPPEPDFAMHQLPLPRDKETMRRLDSKEFARVVDGYLDELSERR
jgi:hypothetical protein